MSTDDKNACCKTRYPILLVHGVSLRDGEKGRSWRRIPQTLRAHGAWVFAGGHDGWGTPISNAHQLHRRIEAILAETGATKVNVIAHSKGGLDTRHLIKLYEEGAFERREIPIASLTTIATPHHGSRTLDALYSRFRPVFRVIAFFIDRIYRIAGDEDPDFYTVCECLTASYMQRFNEEQPSLTSLYSQQFAGSIKRLSDSYISLFTYPIIKRFDSPNDGLVTLASAVFDNYRGEIVTKEGRGIAHASLVDILRKPFRVREHREVSSVTSLDELLGVADTNEAAPSKDITGAQFQVEDILDFHIALVADLKARGY